MKRLIAVFMALVLFTFCGCSVKSIDNVSSDMDAQIIFTDALNREIHIEKSPERVAALIGSFADVWQLSGGSVCAAAEDAWDDFGLELGDAVNIGGAHSPSVESLLSADPDFVIASASTASNVEMKETLENAGITVAYFDVDCFEDYLSMLDICTDITGRKDLYVQNGTMLQAQIDAIKEECLQANLPENERKILLLRASSGFVKAKGSEGTILGEMLADLGCINIADSDEALLENLSVESVIREEPYRIFVVTMGDDTETAIDNLTRMMDENPAWGSLEAVSENRLHIMDRKLFNIKPNAKWAEAYEQLSAILLEKDK
ncbi:MAG: ABC transporter substrate-binding protein [Faecousia sp.]